MADPGFRLGPASFLKSKLFPVGSKSKLFPVGSAVFEKAKPKDKLIGNFNRVFTWLKNNDRRKNECMYKQSLAGYPKSMRLANIGPQRGLAGVNYGCVLPRKIAGCSSGGSTGDLQAG